MNFEDIEIELSNGLVAYVSGAYDVEEVEAGDPNSPDCGWAWVVGKVEIKKVEVFRDGEACDDWSFDELERKLEAHLNKELDEYEP